MHPANRPSFSRVAVWFAIFAAISLLQYVLVTNGYVTGDFTLSDTGRLSPWPTYLRFPLEGRFAIPVRWLLSAFVAPAYSLVHMAANYAHAHQDSSVFRVFAWAYRSPQHEHLFLSALTLFNIGAWLVVLGTLRGLRSLLRRPGGAA